MMAVMANYWAEQGHDLTLITLTPAEEDFYPLHTGIRRVGLGLTNPSTTIQEAMWNNVVRLKRLREAILISHPAAVISFIEKTNILVLMSTIGLSIPVIACEQIDPRHHRIDRVWALLRWVFYRRGAALVVQTEGVRRWAEQFVKTYAVYVIPNAVPCIDRVPDTVPTKKRAGNTVMAMGRLVPQKGFDNLLQAFARCAEKHSEWSLIIIGEGGERSRLEALTHDLGMQNRVTLVGQIQNPFQILRQADLFVLSSRYEGFPDGPH